MFLLGVEDAGEAKAALLERGTPNAHGLAPPLP